MEDVGLVSIFGLNENFMITMNNNQFMLMKADHMCIVLVDLQPVLTAGVIQSEQLIKRCADLLEAAHLLQIATFATVHCPQKLGEIDPSCAKWLSDPAMPKTSFSIMQDASIRRHITTLPYQQYVLIGIEAHICIMQSAFDLLCANKTVFVVADSIAARTVQDKNLAMDRMRAQGVQIVTWEMLLFECLGTAAHPVFKSISQRFLK